MEASSVFGLDAVYWLVVDSRGNVGVRGLDCWDLVEPYVYRGPEWSIFLILPEGGNR